jgi:hypothetical protein
MHHSVTKVGHIAPHMPEPRYFSHSLESLKTSSGKGLGGFQVKLWQAEVHFVELKS